MSGRVLIFGTGSVGIVYAYILTQAGCEVTTVCRGNYEQASRSGFTISSKIFGDVSLKPKVVSAVPDVSKTGQPFDYIVICSKAIPSSPSTADIIAPAVAFSTTIVLAQNGIAIEEEYATKFPTNPLLSGVIYLPVTQSSPAHVTHGPLERLQLGTYPSSATSATARSACEAFAALFKAGGATAEVYDDIQPKRWSKLLVNAAWNPICALSLRSDTDFMRASESGAAQVRAVMGEIVQLAQAMGYGEVVNDKEADWQLSRAVERFKTVGVEPSMLADVRGGKRIEIESIVGNAIKLAKDKGVPVPRLELLYCLGKGLDEALRSR